MKSIKNKIFIIFLLAILLSVGLIILLNQTLFLKYSLYQNEKSLTKFAEDIISYSSEADNKELVKYAYQITKESGVFVISPQLTKVNGNMEEAKPYRITKATYKNDAEMEYRITFNPQGKQQSMELLIRLEDGRMITLRMPNGIVKRNVQVSNNFIMIASCIALLLGGVFLYIMVDRETKPIRKLHKQTEKIAQLDFSDRTYIKGKNEIAKLGDNINRISDELSKNIVALQYANDNLLNDVDMLKQVDEMRKQFIATVSHEFKTPIGIIASYAEGIKYKIVETENERNQYVDIILDESERMASMVRDLVQLMKMQLNEFKLEKENVDIADFLCEFDKRYKGIVQAKQVTLHVEKAPHIQVLMDRLRITQVLDNFISNAINHVPSGGRITIWVEKGDKGVWINVENTGSHIDEDKIPYIWDSFFRVDKARSRELGGSGLGLAIVKGIIEAHCGEYGVRNTEDGIHFFIMLQHNFITS